MSIIYTGLIPNADDLYALYEIEGWNNFLKLQKEVLHQAMVQSWCVLSAYHENRLVGTARVISDGIINAYLCGLIVHPDYRNKGIGTELIQKLVDKCKKNNLHVQFFSEEKNSPYYEKQGFKRFAIGFKPKLY